MPPWDGKLVVGCEVVLNEPEVRLSLNIGHVRHTSSIMTLRTLHGQLINEGSKFSGTS